MDPVSAVGLASGILSFIDFAAKLVRGTYEVYQSGTTADNDHIGNVLGDLQRATKELSAIRNLDLDDHHQRALSSLVKNCLQLSHELAHVLDKLHVKDKNKKWTSVKSAWKNMVKQNTIISLEKRLGEYRSEIILRLNLMISAQNTLLQTHLNDIEQKGLKLGKSIGDQNALVGSKLQEVLRRLETSSSSVPPAELQRAISLWSQSTKEPEMENWILEQLHFNTMFLREDSIHDPETGTFEWLLSPQPPPVPPSLPTSRSSSFRTANSTSSDSIQLEGRRRLSQSSTEKEPQEENAPRYRGRLEARHSFELSNDGIALLRAGDSVSDSPGSIHFNPEISHDSLENSARSQASTSFRSFLSDSKGLFFISGKAGSGKSTIMKYLGYDPLLERDLQDWAGENTLIFARFFFWNSGDRMQMSLVGFYRSLLFEILRQCPTLIQVGFPDLWKNMLTCSPVRERQDIPLSFAALKGAMQRVMDIGLPSKALCLMVDGLDEYEGDALDHFELARLLKRWSLQENVKVICSARPHTEFIDTFDRTDRMIHLHELTRSDIRCFSQVQFAAQEHSRLEKAMPNLFDEVTERIVQMADGVFLWARLVVRSLLIGMAHDDSPNSLMERLNSTPRDINNLFQKILASVDSNLRTRSDQMLSLALGNPFGAHWNALAYSWLEDLSDPQFPYDRPCDGMTGTEVRRRHRMVRHQLDSLTRGLLDIKKLGYRHKSQTSTEDDYWGWHVGFLHRSVRDFLSNHWNGDHNLVSTEDHIRLRLAEVKFGAARRIIGENTIYSNVFTAFDDIASLLQNPEQLNCTDSVVKQLDSILSRYKDLSMSYPLEVKPSFWGCTVYCSYYFQKVIRPSNNIDFLQWAATETTSPHIQKAVAKIEQSPIFFGRKRDLLVSLSLQDRAYQLVEFLFNNGMYPEVLCPVYLTEGFTNDATGRSTVLEVPAWVLFLRLWLGESFKPTSIGAKYTMNLKEYLKAGADTDVIILGFCSDRPDYGRSTIFNSFTPNFPKSNMIFYMELDEVLRARGLYEDPEIEALVRPTRWLSMWRQTSSLFTRLAAWDKETSFRHAYRHATSEELNHPYLMVYGVVTKDSQLMGNFFVTLYGDTRVHRAGL